MANVLLLQNMDGQLTNQQLVFADASKLYIRHLDRGNIKMFFKNKRDLATVLDGRPPGQVAERAAAVSWSFDVRAVTQLSQTMLQVSLVLVGDQQIRLPNVGEFITQEWDFISADFLPVGARQGSLPILPIQPMMVAGDLVDNQG